MFFRSIRFRLTLWYVLTLAVILAASGFFWQLYLSRNMLSHIDDRLLLVAQDVGSFHELHHEEPPSAAQCQALEDFIRLHNWGEFVQILSDRGISPAFRATSRGFTSLSANPPCSTPPTTVPGTRPSAFRTNTPSGF